MDFTQKGSKSVFTPEHANAVLSLSVDDGRQYLCKIVDADPTACLSTKTNVKKQLRQRRTPAALQGLIYNHILSFQGHKVIS